jgi:hypothetical protein
MICKSIHAFSRSASWLPDNADKISPEYAKQQVYHPQLLILVPQFICATA